jgi:hypothetical protein
MALIDVNASAPAFDPARARSFHDTVLPQDALNRLSVLHDEAGANLKLSQFLARSPLACVMLMATGALVLAWASLGGGGTLKDDFAWTCLVLIGVIAMTRNFIRGYARSLRRVPLQEAASDLRVLLLYCGAVWGVGAFLVMPGLPAPLLVFAFAAVPSLALTLVLKDEKGAIAFVVPVSLITAGAAILGVWPLEFWVAGAVLLAGSGIIAPLMLRRAMRDEHNPVPGLVLR